MKVHNASAQVIVRDAVDVDAVLDRLEPEL